MLLLTAFATQREETMSHNLRSKKKKRTDEPIDSGLVVATEKDGANSTPVAVVNSDAQGNVPHGHFLTSEDPKTPPSSTKKLPIKVSADVASEAKPHSLEDVPSLHNAAVLKAQRFLTPGTMEAVKGRVWMVANDKVFTISDKLSLITELAAQWIESCIAPDNPVDADSIYITACDNVEEAMSLAKLQGADRCVTIDKAALAASPGVVVPPGGLVGDSLGGIGTGKNLSVSQQAAGSTGSGILVSAPVMKVISSPSEHHEVTSLKAGAGVHQAVVQRNPYGVASPSRSSSTPDTPSKVAAAAVSAMKVSTGEKLDLSGISVDDGFVKNLVRQRMEETAETSGGGFLLLVSGSGVVTCNGKARFVGCFAVVDESDGSVLWAFKAQAVALTFLVLSDSAPQLRDLRAVSETMHPTPIRRYENGSNIPKTVKGKKGGEFPVEAVAFFADLTGKVHAPEEELGTIINKLNSVITSSDFKKVYLKCMKEIPKMAKLANSIGSDDNPVWTSFKSCKLEVKVPLPLSTYMMDAEISAAMSVLVDEGDQSCWTPEQRMIAYLDGKLPVSGGLVAVKSEF